MLLARRLMVAERFTPLSLFGSGENGVWWDIQDPSSMNTLSDQTGSTPSAGDPVGYIADKSGNSNNGTQATLASRPILRQDVAGKYYLEFDTADDGVDISSLQLMVGRWTATAGYDPTGNDFILVSHTGEGNPWVGIGQDGSTSTTLSGGGAGSGAGSLNATYYDNTLFTGSNRDNLFDSAQLATTIFVDFTASDADARFTDWSPVRIGKYSAGAFTTPGNLYDFAIIDREITSAERAEMQSYLEALTP